MKKSKIFVLIILQMFIGSLFLANSFSPLIKVTQSNDFETTHILSIDTTLLCPKTALTPTIDGLMSPGEWNDAARYYFFFRPTSGHPDDNISIFLKHNDTHLFMCYDVEPDDDNSTDDAGHLFLDLNNTGNKDVSFQVVRDGSRFVSQTFIGNLPNLNFTAAFGFNLTAQEPARTHTIIEWMISINRTANYIGQNLTSASSLPFGTNPIGVVFGGYGTLSPEWLYGNQTDDNPVGTNDASFYADLLLLDRPLLNLLCPYKTITPKIDGIMTPGEWDDATRYHFFFKPISNHPDDNISVFLKHDNTHLYICYDVEPDNNTDANDAGFLFLDLNNNGTKDLRFHTERGGYRDITCYFGPSLNNLNYTVAFGFNVTGQESGRNHTIIEWMISINRTVNYTGQNLGSVTSLPLGINPIGIVFGGYGTLDPEWYYGNQTNDKAQNTLYASFYANMRLLERPSSAGEQNLLPLLLLMLQGAGDQLIIPLTVIFVGIGAAVVLILVYLKKQQ